MRGKCLHRRPGRRDVIAFSGAWRRKSEGKTGGGLPEACIVSWSTRKGIGSVHEAPSAEIEPE